SERSPASEPAARRQAFITEPGSAARLPPSPVSRAATRSIIPSRRYPKPGAAPATRNGTTATRFGSTAALGRCPDYSPFRRASRRCGRNCRPYSNCISGSGDCFAEFRRGGKAVGGDLGERPCHALLDPRRYRITHGAERWNRIDRVPRQQLLRCSAGEWGLARKHLVEHAPERVQVTPSVQVPAAGSLLRT